MLSLNARASLRQSAADPVEREEVSIGGMYFIMQENTFQVTQSSSTED